MVDYTKRPAGGAQPGAGGPASGPGVSLSKVTLTKSAPTVSLSKQGGAGGTLRVNLNWTARTTGSGRGGFLSRLTGGRSGAIDLDLACLWELTDGAKGVVQALGNSFTAHVAPQSSPIIWLDADDRSGASAGGENLFVDLNQAGWIRRVLVFAFIYEGTPNWAEANAVATLFPVAGPQVEVRLDEHDPAAPMCAIALLENQGGEIIVRREVRYIRGGQSALDRAYGWGMDWTPGRK